MKTTMTEMATMTEGMRWLARTLSARRAYRAHLALAQDRRWGAARMRVHEALAAEWLARVRVRSVG